MPRFPSITPKKLLKILEKNGFAIDHVTGSHYVLFNEVTKKRITLAYHAKDVPRGMLVAILKEAEIFDLWQ